MTQVQIDGAIVATIDNDSLAALKEFEAAAAEVTAAGPNAGNPDIIAKNLA